MKLPLRMALFNKHYPIMKQLGLKDLSRDLQLNCTISYLFYLYLMFHTRVIKFYVTENFVKFWFFPYAPSLARAPVSVHVSVF